MATVNSTDHGHYHHVVVALESFFCPVPDLALPAPHTYELRDHGRTAPAEAAERIRDADIVILTNLGDEAHGWRVEQLAGHGIRHEVVCNQGGKGRPVRAIVDRHGAASAVFVDDLAGHHASVAEHAPGVWRLHMVAEPRLATVVAPAEAAHARIDDWPAACEWILSKFESAI